MENSRSGEYKLPGPIYRLGGNLVLRMIPWIPSRILALLLRGRFTYQISGEDLSDPDHQGLSVRKLEAMQLPSDLKGKSVLDIGCAEGFFAHECARRGAAPVLGVDSTLGRLVYASDMALKDGLNINYRMGVFPGREFRGKFDYVLCLSVLHHSLSKKDIWKVLVLDEFANDAAILREQLKLLRSLTTDNGKCILEIPYEYDDPVSERPIVDFQVFQAELKAAGFAHSRCLGTWDYNPEHREYKDRIIYVAEA